MRCEQRVLAPLLHGLADDRERALLVRIDVQHDVVGVRGDRRDQRTLDHLVRRVLEQEAVLERAGLVFVAVADDVLVAGGASAHRRPLAVGREIPRRPCRAGRPPR